ncbi:MAG: PqiC family protein [Thermoanaerobaculia bacterium]
MRSVRPLPLILLTLLGGCSIFSRPKNQFYQLEIIPPAGAVAGVSGLPVGVDPIELPPEIVRNGIVVEQKDQKLDVRGTEQWGAPFQEMFTHAIAFDLAARLPEGMVVLPGQVKPPSGSMRPIGLNVARFAAGPGPVVVLDAHWILGGVSHHETIRVALQSLDTPDVVSGMSRAVGELADSIAAGLARDMATRPLALAPHQVP